MAAVGIEPIVDAVANSQGDGGVDEVGGANLNGGSSGHEKLDSVSGGADAA